MGLCAFSNVGLYISLALTGGVGECQRLLPDYLTKLDGPALLKAIQMLDHRSVQAIIIKCVLNLQFSIKSGLINGLDVLKHVEFSVLIFCLLYELDSSHFLGRKNLTETL